MMSDCLISFGSNLGNSPALLAQSVGLLQEASGISRVQTSQTILTQPVGGPSGQSPYLNAVVRCEASLPAVELHQKLLGIEAALGRVRRHRWGSRTVDLDLLLYDCERIETETLSIPHPRMAYRRFVLQPAVEIAGEMKHPVCGCTIKELLRCLDDRANRIVVVDDSPRPAEEWFDQLALSVEDEPFRLVSRHAEEMVELGKDEWQLMWLDSSRAQSVLEAVKLLILQDRQTDPGAAIDFRGPRLLSADFDLEVMRVEIVAAIQAMIPIPTRTE